MARKVFLSFHFDPDSWRASTVRGIGALEGNQPVSANDWETVKRGGDPAIKQWIGGQMKGRTCAINPDNPDCLGGRQRRGWLLALGPGPPVLLSVQNVCASDGRVTATHQRELDLVLYFLKINRPLGIAVPALQSARHSTGQLRDLCSDP